MWPAFLLTLHLSLSLWTMHSFIPSENFTSQPPSLCRRLVLTSLNSFLLCFIYPTAVAVLSRTIFTDIDGTDILEYTSYNHRVRILRFFSWLIGMIHFAVEFFSVCILCHYRLYGVNLAERTWFPSTFLARLDCEESFSDVNKQRLRRSLRWAILLLFYLSLGMLSWSLMSMVVHWGNWQQPRNESPHCDPMDETECILPFPSFHFTVPDNSSKTGWRVQFPADVLPSLKGRLAMDPTFLNELDGFSTMAPLLFYLEGLKNAQESHMNEPKLQGPQSIALSVTPDSITLLLDVEQKLLVHHSAEIDYLDPEKPLVLVFPSQPLRHSAHYALVVANARNANGNVIAPKDELRVLLSNTNENARSIRYRTSVLPSLFEAANWTKQLYDSERLQLIFDFPTISNESQLGQVKAVRDATLNQIKDWDWARRVEVVQIQNNNCEKSGQSVARTIHGKLTVPWFLKNFGPGHRGATLNKEAVKSGTSTTIGKAHFVVHIPCSIRAAALKHSKNATGLKAFLDYGHGVFNNRGEASWGTLLRLANKNGYIIMGMDWRGMSSYDLLIVVKALMSKPSLFVAIRDNLIQGYANKLSLLHFSQNGMLDMDWMYFSGGLTFAKNKIPTFEQKVPSSIFYGISQGGILGAGFSVLLGPTKLITRIILGSPGTPFALILSRSLQFSAYDAIMLLNFYNNRDVRIFLNFAQMLWDSCEGSGLLASPYLETYPRILLQTGLGDPIVPTLAAEALTRALGGVVLPKNPRKDIFGIPEGVAASGDFLGPNVTLTELLFKREYESLPLSDNYAGVQMNDVHWCVREDKTLIFQIEEFINTGRILDVCSNCVRNEAKC